MLYLTLQEVLAMHQSLIQQFGGSHGVRDIGVLESALARPQSGYYASAIEQAAALWESLNQNHAFVDGNKRIAFAAVDVFLRLNGYKITASSTDISLFIENCFNQQMFTYDNLKQWLIENTINNKGSN